MRRALLRLATLGVAAASDPLDYCGHICGGLTCDDYSPHVCAAARDVSGCDCPGCRCVQRRQWAAATGRDGGRRRLSTGCVDDIGRPFPCTCAPYFSPLHGSIKDDDVRVAKWRAPGVR